MIALLLLAAVMIGCTENSRAKSYGGTANMELPRGKKLVVVTWKDDDLWVLTRPMHANEKAETYRFQEESSWGIWEGTYVIKESR
jgi:hypothetical protein